MLAIILSIIFILGGISGLGCCINKSNEDKEGLRILASFFCGIIMMCGLIMLMLISACYKLGVV